MTLKTFLFEEDDIQEILLATIRNAIIFTGILAAAGALVACGVLLDFDSTLCWDLWTCNIAGLVAGFLIGQFTEYVTSFSYKPTQTIAKKSKFGAAGVIIQGLGNFFLCQRNFCSFFQQSNILLLCGAFCSIFSQTQNMPHFGLVCNSTF